MNIAEKYLPVLQRAEENYELDHPHWRIEVLVSLIRWGLENLKHLVENPQKKRVSWDDPFVELHYPVEWNWVSQGDGEIATGAHICGTLTEDNTRSEEEAARTLAKIMANRFNALTLAEATNGVWYEKAGNSCTPVLPAELHHQLAAIPDETERRKAFDELARPFAIGGAYVDYEDMEMADQEVVAATVVERLANFGSLLDIPQISVTGDINGRKVQLHLVFLIHPLIADYDARKAWHPITVGLAIAPGICGEKVVRETPRIWPQRDRAELWKQIFEAVGRLVAKLIPQTEVEESVIINVNAQLKVPASQWSGGGQGETIKRLPGALSGVGEIAGFALKESGPAESVGMSPGCPVCGWWHDRAYTQIRIPPDTEAILLAGVLPDIVRLVHAAHENAFRGLSTKDDALLKACGGYRHPCKAFGDLKRSDDYRRLFDTSRRGFIALRGAVGISRNESEHAPE